jgi:hypothetical protein
MPWRCMGEWIIDPRSLDLVTKFVSDQLHAPAALPQEKNRRYILDRRLEWASEPVWTTWRSEYSCPCRDLNSDPSVVQPAVYCNNSNVPYILIYILFILDIPHSFNSSFTLHFSSIPCFPLPAFLLLSLIFFHCGFFFYFLSRLLYCFHSSRIYVYLFVLVFLSDPNSSISCTLEDPSPFPFWGNSES